MTKAKLDYLRRNGNNDIVLPYTVEEAIIDKSGEKVIPKLKENLFKGVRKNNDENKYLEYKSPKQEVLEIINTVKNATITDIDNASREALIGIPSDYIDLEDRVNDMYYDFIISKNNTDKIIFYDPEGNIVDVWKLSELDTKTELPLFFTDSSKNYQFNNWNYTLNEIKTINRPLNVGAICSGKGNRFYVKINVTSNDSILSLNIDNGYNLTINWGDGETTTSPLTNFTHTYSIGTYIIQISSTTSGIATITKLSGSNIDVRYIIMCNNIITNVALKYYTNLEYITLPNTITYLGTMFKQSNIKNIILPKSITSLTNSAFEGCADLVNISIPNTVKKLPNNTFDSCTSLANIIIPDSVTSIGNYSFYKCTSLKHIYLPNTITSIDVAAFSSSSLESIDLPQSLTKISSHLFYGCTSLLSVTIPDSVTVIDSYAFENCTSLLKIEIPYSVTTINNNAFMGCEMLRSIVIPDSVITIGNALFSGCLLLQEITLPSTITEIPQLLFYKCKLLSSFSIPSNITSINARAFESCLSLEYIVIPDTVTNIGDYAFDNCLSLNTASYKSGTTIGTDVFPEHTQVTIR